jgi:hypothetical protein
VSFVTVQEHQNEDLYEKAVAILETYFECEEGDDQNLAPQLAGNQYAFGQAPAQVRTAWYCYQVHCSWLAVCSV